MKLTKSMVTIGLLTSQIAIFGAAHNSNDICDFNTTQLYDITSGAPIEVYNPTLYHWDIFLGSPHDSTTIVASTADGIRTEDGYRIKLTNIKTGDVLKEFKENKNIHIFARPIPLVSSTTADLVGIKNKQMFLMMNNVPEDFDPTKHTLCFNIDSALDSGLRIRTSEIPAEERAAIVLAKLKQYTGRTVPEAYKFVHQISSEINEEEIMHDFLPISIYNGAATIQRISMNRKNQQDPFCITMEPTATKKIYRRLNYNGTITTETVPYTSGPLASWAQAYLYASAQEYQIQDSSSPENLGKMLKIHIGLTDVTGSFAEPTKNEKALALLTALEGENNEQKKARLRLFYKKHYKNS